MSSATNTMTSQSATTALRKAAILISTLDERSADALLEQMGEEQAARVRNAIMELDDISPDEQRQVIAEFLRREQGGKRPSALTGDDGVELSPSLVERMERQPLGETPPPSGYWQAGPAGSDRNSAGNEAPRPSNQRPFHFLKHVDSRALAVVLEREHPQTIAVVLAHLEPEQTAELLACLPSETSIEALARMARLDELSPEVLLDIERELETRLPHLATARLQPRGVANIQAVLSVLSDSQREQLLGRLAHKDTRLLRRLGYLPAGEDPFADAEPRPRQPIGAAPNFARFPWTGSDAGRDEARDSRIVALRIAAERGLDLTSIPGAASPSQAAPNGKPRAYAEADFDNLLQLDSRSLSRLANEAEPQLVALALTGADATLVRRVLRQFPSHEAEAMRRQIQRPTPLRLRDIELARQSLLELAQSLADRGEITLPHLRGFAAAA